MTATKSTLSEDTKFYFSFTRKSFHTLELTIRELCDLLGIDADDLVDEATIQRVVEDHIDDIFGRYENRADAYDTEEFDIEDVNLVEDEDEDVEPSAATN